MGTRFLCTVEAPVHVRVKEAIVGAGEGDTELVLRRWRNTSRLFGNKVAKEAVRVERESTTGKFEGRFSAWLRVRRFAVGARVLMRGAGGRGRAVGQREERPRGLS